jgi:hypothetical protein
LKKSVTFQECRAAPEIIKEIFSVLPELRTMQQQPQPEPDPTPTPAAAARATGPQNAPQNIFSKFHPVNTPLHSKFLTFFNMRSEKTRGFIKSKSCSKSTAISMNTEVKGDLMHIDVF